MRNLKLTGESDYWIPQKTEATRRYYQEIGKYENSDVHQEPGKFEKIRQGDRAAAEDIITSHTKFVARIAQQYVRSGFEVDDLIQEGNMWLCKAIHKFDTSRGFKFTSYLVRCVQGAILGYIINNRRLLNCPMDVKMTILPKIRKIQENFLKENGYPLPTSHISELYANLHDVWLTQEKLSASLEYDQEHISLGHGDMIDKESLRELPEKIYTESLRGEIMRSLNMLTQREKDVVIDYYGIGKERGLGLEEIGEKYDLTRERARQIKEKAVRRMKHTGRSKNLKEYLWA